MKINEYIGAEVTRVNLNKPISEAIKIEIYNALLDNVALIIRDQNFSAEEFMQAVSLFGELMEDQNRRYLADDVPMVSVLSNRHVNSTGKPAKIANNATWHTDHINQEYPPKFTALYPVALPDTGVGTALCNMRAAYAALSDEWKIKIDHMKTANTLIGSARSSTGNLDIVKEQEVARTPPMIPPLVRTHPEYGTRSIWFHKAKTENIMGMEPQETQEFLEEAIRPEFTYTHKYKLSEMLFIDNRSSMHKAGFDYDHNQHRILYRALVRGDRPF